MHKFHSRDGNVCLPYTGGVVLKIYTTNLNEVQVANFQTPLNGTGCNVAKAGQLSLNRLFLGTGRGGGGMVYSRPRKFGKRCAARLPKTLPTLPYCKTKMCYFPHPIYYLTKNLIPEPLINRPVSGLPYHN